MSRVGENYFPVLRFAANEMEKRTGLKPTEITRNGDEESFRVSIYDMLFIEFTYKGGVLKAVKRSDCDWLAELSCRATTNEEIRHNTRHIAYMFLHGLLIRHGEYEELFNVEKPTGIFGRGIKKYH